MYLKIWTLNLWLSILTGTTRHIFQSVTAGSLTINLCGSCPTLRYYNKRTYLL